MSSVVTKNKKTSKALKPEDELTIGFLAKICGITVRALRYYEEMDLIRPVKRTAGKYRVYNQRSLKRVKAILALQALNYSLEEILKMLGPYSEGLLQTKKTRIESTQTALEIQKSLIEGKLVSLQDFKTDIDKRMKALAEFCTPCLEKTPQSHCLDSCDYRDLHFS